MFSTFSDSGKSAVEDSSAEDVRKNDHKKKDVCELNLCVNVRNVKNPAVFVFQSDVDSLYYTIPDLPPPSSTGDRM